MFKKKCSKCYKKIDKGYDYCPFCGNNLIKNEDYGILGKSDIDEFMPESLFGSSIIDKLFKTAMNMMERQMKDAAREINKPQRESNPFGNVDVQFFVNGKKVNFANQPKQIQTKKIQIKKPEIKLSEEQIKQLSKLPRKEPKSEMKRIGNKIIYEFSVPGVEEINNVLINQLETSIEIKAIAKTKVYTKTINVNLPILGYKLEKPNLILELQAK